MDVERLPKLPTGEQEEEAYELPHPFLDAVWGDCRQHPRSRYRNYKDLPKREGVWHVMQWADKRSLRRQSALVVRRSVSHLGDEEMKMVSSASRHPTWRVGAHDFNES